MKAWILHGIGDIRFEEAKMPVPKDGEVLVRVAACGICGSDVPRVYETGAHKHPIIIGHEFSGVVEDAKSADIEWEGKRVGIFPLIPCKQCLCCKKKQYELCENYSYLGSRTDGGFGEFVSVPKWNLIELPEEVSFEAAAMLEPMAVAMHATRRAYRDITLAEPICDENDFICVIGLGTIGMLVACFLRELGHERLLLVGNKDSQREKLIQLGFSEGCFVSTKDEDAARWIEKKTKARGAAAVFECVGRTETFSLSVEAAAANATVVLVGNPANDAMSLSKNIYWKILRKQLFITGTWNSSFRHEADDDWEMVLSILKRGSLHPEGIISHRLPPEDLEKGLLIMRDKSEPYGKVMIVQGGRER